LGPEGRGHALGRTNQLGACRAWTYTNEKSLGGGPGALGRTLLPGGLDIDPQTLGGLAQRQLSERGQVRLLEKVLQSPFGLRSNVNLACFEPFNQILRRQIDQLDVVSAL